MEETHTSCPPRSCRELLSGPEHFVCTCVSLLLFSFAGVRVLDVSDIAPSALRGFEELYGKSGGRRTKAAHVRGEEPLKREKKAAHSVLPPPTPIKALTKAATNGCVAAQNAE